MTCGVCGDTVGDPDWWVLYGACDGCVYRFQLLPETDLPEWMREAFAMVAAVATETEADTGSVPDRDIVHNYTD